MKNLTHTSPKEVLQECFNALLSHFNKEEINAIMAIIDRAFSRIINEDEEQNKPKEAKHGYSTDKE